MRGLLLIVWLLPAVAIAKPSLALAPIVGDKTEKVTAAVTEIVEQDAQVISPAKVESAMTKLDITEIDAKAVKKLRKKLGAEIIVYGAIEKGSGKSTLTLHVSARGKRTSKFEVEFKIVDKKFKKQLAQELAERLKSEDRDDSNNDDDEDEAPKKVARNDDDVKPRKRRKRAEDDAPVRPMMTQAAIRIDAGGSYARRTLTYAGGGAAPPPSVGTAGAAGRIEAEIYPGAMDTTKGFGAALGVVGEFEKTFGVGIDVPGGTGTATVDQGRYAIGARYRASFGTSSLAFGASYWARHYLVDRTMGTLDAPDVSYKAVAIAATARFAATPTVGVFVGVGVPLVLSTGEIQGNASYGPADVIAFELQGGADIMVAPHFAIHLAVDFDQVGLSFSQKVGTMAATRNVTAATDRVYGLTANLAILY